MIDVTNLAQHIATLEPGKNAARLAFFNYLANLCEPRQSITAQLLNSFYARALTFQHWQENRAELFEQTQYCLLSFAKANESDADSVFAELQKSWQVGDIETVAIKNQTNLFG